MLTKVFLFLGLLAVTYGQEVPKENIAPPIPNKFNLTLPTAGKPRVVFWENWIFDDNEFVSRKAGFSKFDDPTQKEDFRKLIISSNLPYSVIRGEVFAVPVKITNFMNETHNVKVIMDNTDNEYDFAEATSAGEEHVINEVKRVKHVTIPPLSKRDISFLIRPKHVGKTTLKITAITPVAGDSIHETLKVKAEGIKKYQNRAYLIDLNDQCGTEETVEIEIPGEAVPGSECVEIICVGDLLGPSIESCGELLQLPRGCGEQTMIYFVPNVLTLMYLEATNRYKPNIIEKAKKHLAIGYERELTFRHDDGSYSVWGKKDASGSTWLTAYVARAFHQAAKYTEIDPKVIIDALDFLASKQAQDGSFIEHGRLLEIKHQSPLVLTSFTLLTFFENVEYRSKYESTIGRAVQFVVDNVDKTDNKFALIEDLYALSIAALALRLAKNPTADDVLTKLQGLAKTESDLKWWSNFDNKSATGEPARSQDIEITAYITMALLENDRPADTLKIITWLLKNRNFKGGFSSTQDTVVGLQALIMFAEKFSAGNSDIIIEYESSGDVNKRGNIKINPENTLVVQNHVFDRSTRKVHFNAKGEGSCLCQVTFCYNIAEAEKEPSFNVNVNIRNDTTPELLKLEVCAEYLNPEGSHNNETNMAILEIALPSGYCVSLESLNKILDNERVRQVETKNSDSSVIVYFESLIHGDVQCIPVEANKIYAVGKQRPTPVKIYDYYDLQRKATAFYTVETSLCDICDGKDCGCQCNKNEKPLKN